MKTEKIITVMTYEQWEEKFKKNLRRYIKRKINKFLDWFIISVSIPLLFVGMVVWWVVFGY